MAIQFLPTGYTDAYRQYYEQAVEIPLRRQRARTLQDLYAQQAARGILRSGVSMYPVTQLEQSIVDVLGREGARLALAQAERQVALEEAERQRQFQREMLERQIQIQREILEEQKKLAEQQMWGQLLGSLAGMVLMPPLGALGGLAAGWLTKTIAPSVYARQQALQDLLMQYYKGIIPTTQTASITPVTAGTTYGAYTVVTPTDLFYSY